MSLWTDQRFVDMHLAGEEPIGRLILRWVGQVSSLLLYGVGTYARTDIVPVD